jgi:hypothetical protein
VIILNLKRIVNEAWDLDDMDINKLSRYMRCLLRYACAEGGAIAEGLLDQVRDLAYNAQKVGLDLISCVQRLIVSCADRKAIPS